MLTPEEIYVRAVAAARAEPVPAYVTYRASYEADGAVIVCTDGRLAVSFEGRKAHGTYRVSFRSADSQAKSVDLAAGSQCAGTPLIQPSGSDLTGTGDIKGLVGNALPAPRPAATAPPQDGAPPDIARVHVTTVRNYAVVSSSEESLGDAHVYHLTLRALADRAAYPLTDLYVDAGSFLIRRLAGTFSDRYGGVPATIVASGDFTRDGAYWVETHEHIDFSAPTEPKLIRASLDATASDLAYPATIPDLAP